MRPEREALLRHLKQFGEKSDRAATAHAEKMLNITADTGLMLWMLIRAMAPRSVLEVGTSNGYSTIWWADAVPDGARLVTLEADQQKLAMARANFQEAGLAGRIELVPGDAREFLKTARARDWDLIFLDADRKRYVNWWPDLFRILAEDGLLVVDNALDKADELEGFRSVVAATSGSRQVLVPIGNGELFIQHDRDLL